MTLWNGHFIVRLPDETKMFKWQHCGATVEAARKTLRAAAEREYPGALWIECHVFPHDINV